MVVQENKMYQRRLSAKELENKRIMVLKNWLAYFPEINRQFKIKYDNLILEGKIIAEDCNCRGINEPHQHFFLLFNYTNGTLPFFKPNAPISIMHLTNGEYLLM